jgi:hypothetical protein
VQQAVPSGQCEAGGAGMQVAPLVADRGQVFLTVAVN